MSATRRILIVDDSPEDREAYRRLLEKSERLKCDILETDSGEDALKLCQESDLDCVLLDYNLPDLDGLEFLQELTRQGNENCVAVVMLTGTGNESVAVEAMKRGSQDYLIKGALSAHDLARAISHAIDKVSLLRELEMHRQDLERSNEELTRFAFAASHDLQAPLRRTINFCQLFQRRFHGNLDEEADEMIECIIQCSRQMQALVDALLQYARVGTRENRLELTDCSAAIDEALDNLEVEIQESQAQVTRDELPMIHADPVQLVQLIQNLISNAIKYRGPESPRIHVSAVDDGSQVTVRVSDNGMGIDPKYCEQVFEVFKRLHGDEVSGSGIGLATCKKIVERHEGQIWVESQLDKGSDFCFTIPHKESRESPASSAD